MINVGQIYYDTILQTLFIVDAVSNTRVYLLEFKEKIDPRVVVEQNAATMLVRYKLTNIGDNKLVDQTNINLERMSLDDIEDVITNRTIYSTNVNDSSKPLPPYHIQYKSKPTVKAKAKPGRKPVKKVTKKLIKKPNKK